VTAKPFQLREWVLQPKRYSRLLVYVDACYSSLVLVYSLSGNRKISLTVSETELNMYANKRDFISWNIKRLRAHRKIVRRNI